MRKERRDFIGLFPKSQPSKNLCDLCEVSALFALKFFRTVQRATPRAASPLPLRTTHYQSKITNRSIINLPCFLCIPWLPQSQNNQSQMHSSQRPLRNLCALRVKTTYQPTQSKITNRSIGNKTFRVFCVFRGCSQTNPTAYHKSKRPNMDRYFSGVLDG